MCWQTNTDNPNVANYNTVDFEVTWNKDMTGVENYPQSEFMSGSDVDNVLCDISRTDDSNMHNSITYDEKNASTSLRTWSGFGRQNLALYNGLALGNQDAWLLEWETMDGCLSHASPNNYAQHAHSISPCVNGDTLTGSTTQKPHACNTPAVDCDADGFFTTGWSTSHGTYGGVYGLAKDGHVIYGPYNADGEAWECEDVDLCNGFVLADGSYGYASTTFFPYMVGCWGPAYATHEWMPSCTTNGCGESQGAMVGLSLSALALAATTLINL